MEGKENSISKDNRTRSSEKEIQRTFNDSKSNTQTRITPSCRFHLTLEARISKLSGHGTELSSWSARAPSPCQPKVSLV